MLTYTQFISGDEENIKQDEDDEEKTVMSGLTEGSVIGRRKKSNKTKVSKKSKCTGEFHYDGNNPTLEGLDQLKADQVTLSTDDSSWKRLPLNSNASNIHRCVSFFTVTSIPVGFDTSIKNYMLILSLNVLQSNNFSLHRQCI